MEKMDFKDYDATVHLYLEMEDDKYIEFTMSGRSQTEKLNKITVIETIDAILENCDPSEGDNEEVQTKAHIEIAKNPGYSVQIYDSFLRIEKDILTGIISKDEKETAMDNPLYWKKELDINNNEFYLSEIIILENQGLGGSINGVINYK